MDATANKHRCRINVSGIVQGVGFRPFVYRLAHDYGITGFVRNVGGTVQIEAQSEPENITAFLRALREQAPPLSKIDDVECISVPTLSDVRPFEILQSASEGEAQRSVSKASGA